jgi:hypothetical protein
MNTIPQHISDKANKMKNTFDLKTWLTGNKETVIAKYNECAAHDYFSGITLRDFMFRILDDMQLNNPKSEKKAASTFTEILSNVYYSNTNVLNSLFIKSK